MNRAEFLNGGVPLTQGGRVTIGPDENNRLARPVEANPPLERSDRAVRTFLAGLATAVALLFPLGLATGWAPLLLTHFVGQVIMALIVGSMLLKDRRVPDAEKGLWAAGFIFVAPLMVPTYAWKNVVFGADGTGRRTRWDRTRATSLVAG